jgi:hypothetical protein
MDHPYRTLGHAPRSDEPTILDLVDCDITEDCDDCRDLCVMGPDAVRGHHPMCRRVRGVRS